MMNINLLLMEVLYCYFVIRSLLHISFGLRYLNKETRLPYLDLSKSLLLL
jgi:hypothetical protein